jgi:hypothetical protein
VAQKDKQKMSSEEEILRVARERFKLAQEAETKIREVALEDLEFRSGKQWPEDVRQERTLDGRPTLVINRIPQFIRQITNDQRQNRPSIKVSPVDDKGDVETGKILQGIIRHIEYDSNADIAYDTAFEGAALKGFGYFRIITDFVSPQSFNQEIKIKRIRNSFTVYLDPHAKEPDGSDAKWGFIFDDVEKEDFESEYKNAKLSNMSDWESIGDRAPGWVEKSSVKVAEYFYVEHKEITLVLLSDGSVLDKSTMPEEMPPEMAHLKVVNERKTLVPTVKWCKMNGIEILEETDWPGQWIPIIPVYGDELDVNGERILEGVIRHAKDSQRMYNYWASTETETIALAPRAPFIVAEGQIPPEYEGLWKSANRKNHAYLPYKPTSIGGVPVGPPQRNVYEAPIQAITQARGQAADDLKATTGIYDSALGSSPNDTSGIAIQRRNHQSQTSNFHFIDNLTRSLRHAGRILVDLIPKVYDTPRAVRILGDDGEQEIVMINQLFQHKGKQVTYDLGAGKYDVTIATGPSYATKRQEAVASMLDLCRSNPQIGALAADLMVKSMDWPGAQEIADRLKKALPPGIADDPNSQQAQIPPQAQAQLKQMSDMINQLTQHTNAMSDEIKTKKFELESRERIALMQNQTELAIAEMKISPNQAMKMVIDELAHIKARMEIVGIHDPVAAAQQAQQPPQEMPQPQPSAPIGAGPQTAAPGQMQNQQPTGGLSPG